MKETLVTRGYVYAGEGDTYTLDYYIKDRANSDYTIRIKATQDGGLIEEAEQPLCGSRSFAEDTVHMLAGNFVFPVHLKQIIDDIVSPVAKDVI